MAITESQLPSLEDQVAGLDELETEHVEHSRLRAAWSGTWPKLLALGIVVLAWQIVVWSHWRPDYVLPGPKVVIPDLWHKLQDHRTWEAVRNTGRRAVIGLLLSLLVGVVVGLLVTSSKVMRSAIGSMITGLQTMPSIAWYPLAIVLFKLSESAIMFVVVVGSAPAVANGIISGVDHIPPILQRAGRVLGAKGWNRFRYVVLPAALPSFLAGLKQAWAFLWRSLMAGELLGNISKQRSIGLSLSQAREVQDFPGVLSWMIIILALGIIFDALVFGRLERTVRERRGLTGANA